MNIDIKEAGQGALILDRPRYLFFDQTWLNIIWLEDMLWNMYVDFAEDADHGPIPRWDYYMEDDNEFTASYDEIASYITFGDFDHYLYPNSEEEIEKFWDTLREHGANIDKDYIQLFNKMRLFMYNIDGDLQHIPLVSVW